MAEPTDFDDFEVGNRPDMVFTCDLCESGEYGESSHTAMYNIHGTTVCEWCIRSNKHFDIKEPEKVESFQEKQVRRVGEIVAESAKTLNALRKQAIDLGVSEICHPVLVNYRFPLWSGSHCAAKHHYGIGGLIKHTAEVIDLCLTVNKMTSKLPENIVFLAAFFHDVGKMWDYQPGDALMGRHYREVDANSLPEYDKDKLIEFVKSGDDWEYSGHRSKIHHITRSVLVFTKAAHILLRPETIDDITHAILAHHGRLEAHSPVTPDSSLAWLVHLCDSLSAKLADRYTHYLLNGRQYIA